MVWKPFVSQSPGVPADLMGEMGGAVVVSGRGSELQAGR